MSKITSELFFGYSTSTVRDTRSINKPVGLDELISIIKNTQPSDSYLKIADYAINMFNAGKSKAEVKDKIDPLKINLPYFLFSGFMPVGHSNAGIDYNGCVQIDIDFKEMIDGDKRAARVKEQLRSLPYVLFAGISPSGVGVKGLVSTTNLDKAHHITSSNQVIAAICEAIGEDAKYFDSIGAGSVSYAFYDANLYVNPHPTQFIPSISAKQQRAVGAATAPRNSGAIVLPSAQSHIERLCRSALASGLKKSAGKADTIMVQTYASICVKHGISLTAADTFICAAYPVEMSENDSKRLKSLHSLYTTFAPDFGIWAITEQPSFSSVPSNTLKLAPGQKLSDIASSIVLSDRTLLISPTNSGKTYYVSKLPGKRILVVPTQAMVRQVVRDYSAAPYYGDAKKATVSDDFIVTTYASLANLAETLDDCSERTVFLDEVHTFSSNTSSFYQHAQYSSVARELHRFGQVVGLTATPLECFDERVQFNKIISVKNEKQIEKKWNYVFYKRADHGYVKSILEQAVACKSRNEHFNIYLNNLKEDSIYGELRTGFQQLGMKIAYINSKEKNSADFEEIVVEGDMSDFDGCVATVILKEGTSITKHSEVVNVFVLGDYHPAEIEQMSARFRKTSKINMLIWNEITESEIAEERPFYFSKSLMKKITADRIELAALLTAAYNNESMTNAGKKIFREHLSTTQSLKWNKIKKEMEIDYLLLSNEFFELEKRGANSTVGFEFMDECLSAHGWKCVFDAQTAQIDASELDESIVGAIRDEIDAATERKVELITEVLAEIGADKIGDNEEKISCIPKNKIQRDEIEETYRKIVKKVARAMDLGDEVAISSVLNVINKIGTSTAAVNLLEKQFEHQRLRACDDVKAARTLKSIGKLMYNSFTVGAEYSVEKTIEIVNAIFTDAYSDSVGDMKQKTVIKRMKEFFDVRVKDGIVTITNDNPTDAIVNVLVNGKAPRKHSEETLKKMRDTMAKKKLLEVM